jgi:hypothetical protein
MQPPLRLHAARRRAVLRLPRKHIAACIPGQAVSFSMCRAQAALFRIRGRNLDRGASGAGPLT